MAISSATELPLVVDVTARLQALLDHARAVKPEATLEPPLPTSELLQDVIGLQNGFAESYDQTYRFATIETAARELFYSLIKDADIEDPSFVEVWNFLDILLLSGDQNMCTPELVCWLIEELLDSLTTDGCRIVFDYLESRRERLAQKDFHKKNLVFLRSCNELLRRLSRAEDAIFCGRVFFFLFQTFPLGDKSSVNLRGEFHVENTTKFEVSASQTEHNSEKMEIDPAPEKSQSDTPGTSTPQPPSKPGTKAVPIKAPPKKVEEEVLSNSDLYPIFWRLQQDFSDPTRLFAKDHFQQFKKGLARTITKFKKTPTVVQTRAAEEGKRGTKRKLGDENGTQEASPDGVNGVNGAGSDGYVDNYNPKYLTSRDLFDLELSDLAFQRHILVQSLILIDYLLSLTDAAKTRILALGPSNKSMLYDFVLNDEDSKWATNTRTMITNYLSTNTEGKLFNRMVETVLARDKNWVRWKVESCPSIVRDPVSTESEIAARKGARDATRVRRVPEKPVGAMDISFLIEDNGTGLEMLKDPVRYTGATIEELLDGIKTDELDLEMAMDEEETAGLENAIASKRWRAIRQTRMSRLELLDKIDETNLDAVFRPSPESELDVVVEDENVEAESEHAEVAADVKSSDDIRVTHDAEESVETS